MIGITVVLLLASCFLQVCSLHEVCIASVSGKSPSYCESTTTINDFCQHANDSDISNTVVTVLNGTHMLNRTCEFHHVNNLTLRGQSQSKTVVQCFSDMSAGFIFQNAFMLTISAIEFIGCGAHLEIEDRVIEDPSKRLSALLFVNGSDLTLTNLTVSDSKSVGIFIRNVVGNVTINSCSVMALISSVGYGKIVEYHPSITKDVNLTMVKSHIRITERVPSNCYHYSKGLNLYLASSKVTVNIEHTNFTENYCGSIGVVFYCSALVTITNTSFKKGSTNYRGSIFVWFTNSSDPDSYNDESKVLSIINSNFTGNSGGAVFIQWEQSLSSINQSAYIDIANSKFDGNKANTGPVAVGITGHANSKFQVILNISRCIFSNNVFDNRNLQPGSELSVITATDVSYLIVDSITVHSNLCTALLALESIVAFSGSNRIYNNSAVSGAGLGLANSVIILTPNIELIITNNSAQQTGGGIRLYEYPGYIADSSTKCFYQINSTIKNIWNTVNFSVFNNHAEEGGDNIFGLTSEINSSCHRSKDHTRPFFPANNAHHPSSLASTANTICLNKCDCISERGCVKETNKTIFPGQQIEWILCMVDTSNTSVSGIVVASTTGSVVINKTEKAQRVGKLGSNATFTLYSSQLSPNAGYIYLNIWADSLNLVTSSIQIIFSECPLGFKITNHDDDRIFKCKCYSIISVISNCSLDSQTIKKRRFSWLGMLNLHNHSYLATNDYCPLDYCNPDIEDIKSHSDHIDQDKQCKHSRTGTLCGSCPKEWSLVLGSSECREKCSNVWLLLIFPFALAGLLLVAVIHFLNLTVTMGTVCGLIFYVNIVQDYSVVLLSTDSIPGLTPILQVFLSWLNLDFGISTCFYSRMEAYGKVMLLFIFPVYIWLISATIIFLSNRYFYFTRLVGENSVKILATLLLLSYSKMLRATIGSLHYKIVSIYVNDSVKTEKRWIINGNISYMDHQKHLTLFVIAIISIMMLFPFTMSLLCIRHVYSLSNCCRVFSLIDKLKPFFDTYTGPFKDKARFWTGLLLLVRLFLLIVNAVDYQAHVIPYYIIIAVCLSLMSAMFILRGVYKRRCLNILEYFFITNICILFLVNSYEGGPVSLKFISWSSHLLVSSAFLVFLGIVSYHVYLKLSHHGLLKRVQLRPQNADVSNDRLSFDGMRDYEPVQQDLNLNAEDTPLLRPTY